jgi:hypothetical protein
MRDYPGKFSKGLMKRKNLPLYEEGGEVEEAQYMAPPDDSPRGTPMSPLPKDVSGDMPVAPDTREVQAADYAGQVHGELEKLNRAKDVEGSFKVPPFKTKEPKKTEI